MIRLTQEQIKEKAKFIHHYMDKSVNASTASKLDANANVEQKNIATMSAEVNKDINIQINRAIISERIEKLFGKELAIEYIRQLEHHEIYCHDESGFQPYCVAIDATPFLHEGMIPLGGESKAPKHLYSYCGGYVNLIFAISSQFVGAVADVAFLKNFHYFAKKDYGSNYLETHTHEIKNYLQHVIYTINQPAAARGFQAVFYNTAIFDKYYFEGIFGNSNYPDGTKATWEEMDKLQKFFMKWFNKERESALLTFPVITASVITENGEAKDLDFKDFLSEELSEGNSFFIYSSDNVDSLSSCCRLRSSLEDNVFSYTLGGVGVSTGSKNVITLNINRLIQDDRDLKTEVEKIHKYQMAFESWYRELYKNGMLPVYSADFISLDKQFLTIGVNGIVEGAEYLGYKIDDNKEYKDWLVKILSTIKNTNKEAGKIFSEETGNNIMFNTEFVPAENLGVKFANWDKADGYAVTRDCYNSYFYIVEDETTNWLDKLSLYDTDTLDNLDGGSACHQNMDEHPTKEGYSKILTNVFGVGCNYFTTNVPITCCNSCGFNSKQNIENCPKCGSEDIDHATRVIGYLKKVKSFSKDRQKEESRRFYDKE